MLQHNSDSPLTTFPNKKGQDQGDTYYRPTRRATGGENWRRYISVAIQWYQKYKQKKQWKSINL